MKRLSWALATMALLVACKGNAGKPAAQTMQEEYDTVNFHMATIEEARQLMSVEDDFTRNWSHFDIVSRLQNVNGTKEQLRQMNIDELREWNEVERARIERATMSINRQIKENKYHLALPKEIILVKTTMNDEGRAAGYTRSNWIALCDYLSERNDVQVEKLLLHELFHIQTRHSIDFKRKMYATIGFDVLDRELEYPKEIWEKHITNPDIARYDSYGEFTVQGKTEKCAMVLYTDRPYTTGMFFEYVKIGFVPYDEAMKPKYSNGQPVVYTMDEVSDFFDKVGRNTDYLLHPDEILAENFVMAFRNTPNLPTPELSERMRKVMRGE